MGQGICTEFSHGFLATDTTIIAGQKCTSEGLFWFVVVFTVALQIFQNFIWTKSGQKGREALMAPKGSAQRELAIRGLMKYTLTSSLLHILNTLLILGANVYILLAIVIGNVLGTYWSYEKQPCDSHDPLGPFRDLAKLNTRQREELIVILDTPGVRELFQARRVGYGNLGL